MPTRLHARKVLLLAGCASTFTNTTEFWRQTLNVTAMHYQCYSGRSVLRQDTRKSIGTTPRDKQECTTASSEHIRTVLPNQIQEYHSSSGFKEDLEKILKATPRIPNMWQYDSTNASPATFEAPYVETGAQGSSS